MRRPPSTAPATGALGTMVICKAVPAVSAGRPHPCARAPKTAGRAARRQRHRRRRQHLRRARRRWSERLRGHRAQLTGCSVAHRVPARIPSDPSGCGWEDHAGMAQSRLFWGCGAGSRAGSRADLALTVQRRERRDSGQASVKRRRRHRGRRAAGGVREEGPGGPARQRAPTREVRSLRTPLQLTRMPTASVSSRTRCGDARSGNSSRSCDIRYRTVWGWTNNAAATSSRLPWCSSHARNVSSSRRAVATGKVRNGASDRARRSANASASALSTSSGRWSSVSRISEERERAYGSCVRGGRTSPWPGRADHGVAVGQLPQET